MVELVCGLPGKSVNMFCLCGALCMRRSLPEAYAYILPSFLVRFLCPAAPGDEGQQQGSCAGAHAGRNGCAFFPGCNSNSSGTSSSAVVQTARSSGISPQAVAAAAGAAALSCAYRCQNQPCCMHNRRGER